MNIVFVVCHPDDEALWIGGLLCELPRFADVRAHVICLSGRDQRSPREREFEEARKVAGYAAGVVLGFQLRPAGEPLPAIAPTTAQGLDRLGMPPDQVSLLVTHPPYGDEHANPHHVQAHRELRLWTRQHQIPFGYFSCLPMSDIAHVPRAGGFRRLGALHLLNRSRCEWAGSARPPGNDCPAEYVQFGIDIAKKRAMLDCYQSIDLAEHERGYAAFTCGSESIYVDALGARVIDAIVDTMPVPGAADLVAQHPPARPTLAGRVVRKLRRGAGL